MSVRELVVLGTASQVPGRHRNHCGFVLRWGAEAILFDPGEGTQRQMTLAGVAPPSIQRICLTHFHGDHCLGLPGIVQRLALDQVDHPVTLHYPAAGERFVERLLSCTEFHGAVDLRRAPFSDAGPIAETGRHTLSAFPLDHTVEAWGYRLEEPAGRTMLPERLAAAGIEDEAVAALQRSGSLTIGDRTVTLDEVSVPRPGQSFAITMDTRPCDGAVACARDVDLLLCESTFLEAEADLAAAHGHCTARQAGWIAREAGARRLVLAHYSQRHLEEADFAAEASGVHPDVVAARDLDRLDVPRQPRPFATGAHRDPTRS